MNESESKYCKQCDHSFHGLDTKFCPECGATFDLTDPHSFATQRRQGRSRRRLIQWSCVVGIGLFFWWADFGLSWSKSMYSCNLCAARKRAESTHVFIIPVKSMNHIEEGPVSRFVQAYSDQDCQHVWEFYTGTSGGLLQKARYCGPGLSRYVWSETIDGYVRPYSPDFLEKKAEADSAFADELIQIIRSGKDRTEPLIQEMIGELMDIAARN